MKEIWKKIEGFDNYSVSKDGEIRNTKTGRTLKKQSNRGYECVSLWKNGKGKRLQVHRLVAIAFIPNPNNLPCVDHINTIKTDNRVENLRWCTQKENCNNPLTRKNNSKSRKGKVLSKEHKQKLSDSHKGKRHSDKAKRKISENNPRTKKVICVTTKEIFENAHEAERQTLIRQTSICRCCKGYLNSAGKHPETGEKLVWMYLEQYLSEVNNLE